ncbi:hypothetical protein KQI63_12045 [bacterium]|nr:hypothetical protein [bacterium]
MGKRARVLGSLALVLLLGMVGVWAATPDGKSRIDPAVADSLVAAGDVDLLKASDIYSLAWEHDKSLQQLLLSSNMSADLLWRQARANIDKGETLGEDEGEPYFTQAVKLAEQAIEMDPKNADAHLMLAIASGRMALLRGPFKAAGLVKQAFHEAHLAATLGDSIPVAFYVIGRTHKKLMEKSGLARTVAGLTFASEDSIPIYFERTLEISHGNMIQCHVEYADYLLKTKNDKAGAKEHCEAALALPLRDEQDGKAQTRAREMMKKM